MSGEVMNIYYISMDAGSPINISSKLQPDIEIQ